MKKIVILTEADLARIVKRVIKEQNEVTPEMIIAMLMREAESTPQEDYDDVYDWMQDVFSPVEIELEEMGVDIDDLRMEYDDVIMGLWEHRDDDLLESELARIVKRAIKEQVTKGRNNPRWIKLFNVLRNIGSPKVLTFKDFDGNPSQSLNWGTTKTSNADYGLAASDAHESFYLMSDNKQLLSSLFKWWSNKGYKTDVIGGEVMINFDNVDKISSDLQNFFKSFSPVGKMSIK